MKEHWLSLELLWILLWQSDLDGCRYFDDHGEAMVLHLCRECEHYTNWTTWSLVCPGDKEGALGICCRSFRNLLKSGLRG